MSDVQKKGERLLPAIAYGDAAGLPFETLSADEIVQQFGRVDRLMPTSLNPYFADKREPGFWSGDTQLSIAVAEGLMAADGFDIDAQGVSHLDAYNTVPAITNKRGEVTKQGWGGSTVAAMERLRSGAAPTVSGTPNGAGNGVLMKMAPLVYWQFARDVPAEERYRQYDELTTMTHNSDVARLTTRIHGDVLHLLMTQGYNREALLALLDDSITLHEYETGTPGAIRDALSYLHGDVSAKNILSHTDGRGFYAPQTLAMAYGAYMQHDGLFRPSVYEAVNLGGDTDSTASIVAAMSNLATRGMMPMGVDHQELDQLSLLKRVSSRLAAQALQPVSSVKTT